MPNRIKLGYEVGTGREVWIPDDRHIGITGQTQRSGKTTTLEALISRATGCALAFITKRGEGSFRVAQKIPAFFYDPLADKNPQMEPWQFVISILTTKVKHNLQSLHRRMIINVCTDNPNKKPELSWNEPRSLDEVMRNVQKAKETSRGAAQKDTYRELEAFMRVALPEIQSINPPAGAKLNRLKLYPGLNVMDIERFSVETQELIIASCLLDIHTFRKNTKLILPESQTFLPQKSRGDRNSEISTVAELISRQGAAIGNLLLLDSQDMAGVDKVFLRAVGVWLFGVQGEHNEIKRMLSMIPNLGSKITPTQIMTLQKGHFLVRYDDKLIHTYVQPAWLNDVHAQAVAKGDVEVESVKEVERQKFSSKTIPLGWEDGKRPDMEGMKSVGDVPEKNGSTDEDDLPETQITDILSDLEKKYDQLLENFTNLTAAYTNLQNRFDLLKNGSSPSTEHGIRTDVRELTPNARIYESSEKVPGAIPGQEGADTRGAANVTDDRAEFSDNAHDTAPPEYKQGDAFKCAGCGADLRGLGKIGCMACGKTFCDPDDTKCLEQHPCMKNKVTPFSERQMDYMWHELHQRAMKEWPGILEVLVARPELHVTVERKTLAVDGTTVRGCLALMLFDGFFAEPRNGNAAYKECQRRGRKMAAARVYEQLDILAAEGFLTKEDSGFLAVPGFKVEKT